MPCPESLYVSLQNENRLTFDRIMPCIVVITTTAAIGVYLYFISHS